MVVNYPNARVVFNHKYHDDHGRTILYPTSVPDWSPPVTTDMSPALGKGDLSRKSSFVATGANRS